MPVKVISHVFTYGRVLRLAHVGTEGYAQHFYRAFSMHMIPNDMVAVMDERLVLQVMYQWVI